MESKIEYANDNSRPWESYHTVYTNAKAGMDGVDKEKVQRIVYEMSKGSKYFENEQRKEAFIKKKIEHMQAQRAKLTAADLSHYQKLADRRIAELEATRDLSKIWLHVDMDAFYAAAETLSNQSLKGKPMAVGSMSMISTANYEARKFGVRAAMPGFIACKLCPGLVIVPTDFKKYNHYSDLTRKVFQGYDPNFVAASLDEAYLDLTYVCKERGLTGAEIAEEIRTRVFEETGLTCSAGVAPNRLLAKVCSDINKPNGQFVLPNERVAVMTFISSLPTRKIGGIGKVTEHVLRDAFGITTCEDMLRMGCYLCALFSPSSADFFLSVGLGLGKTDTPQVRLRKSISNERTFSATDDEALLYQKLAELSEMLAADMEKEGLRGRTLTLKLKTASFEVQTRCLTLQSYIFSSQDILKHASKLLKAELPLSIRLIGLRISQFNDGKAGTPSDPCQRTLNSFMSDISKRNMGDEETSNSEISDHQFINAAESSFFVDAHEKYQSKIENPSEAHCLPDDLYNSHPFSDGGEMERDDVPHCNGASGKENALPIVGCTLREDRNEISTGGCPSLPGPQAQLSEEATTINNDAIVSSNEDEQLIWVDNYKCSLCGTELPPSFIEERREHSDFHLAEKLQKEESDPSFRHFKPCQRFGKRENSSSRGKHKKQKSSPKEGGHIPIDVFFTKSKQNF
ncbi:hypothetical protein ACFE04_010664 [Oxalis oulophora]